MKLKIGIALALPIYAAAMLIITVGTSLVWVIGQVLNFTGMLDGFKWLLEQTKARLSGKS